MIVPWRITSAPYSSLARALVGEALAGMTTVAEIPARAAAQATAWAWLPAETVATPRPRAILSNSRIRFRAPRTLNEPVLWRFSHLRKTGRPPRSDSARLEATGVRCKEPEIRARASWRCSSSGIESIKVLTATPPSGDWPFVYSDGFQTVTSD